MTLRSLYPEIEPFQSGTLGVSGGHRLYYEQSGDPDGKPVIFLHGGPGAGTGPKHRRFFDPTAYRIVLLDQRGAGRSTPFAGLEANTTQDLVADIERLRELLSIERWQVFGGSWGSTLALAYAQTHPGRVTELVLRGIFLGRDHETAWLYGPDGAASLFPEVYGQLLEPIPGSERDDLVGAYHRRLTGDDEAERDRCARAWAVWEASISRLLADAEEIEEWSRPDIALPIARIETHYFVNGCFLESEGRLLDGVERIARVPAVIVQGRYDVVCPPRSAWDLHRSWPASRLEVVPDAGHSAFEPGIVDALVRATDGFR